MSRPIVAIVGSPNVGKSTIFNRLLGKRQSIVNDESGITRDRLYAKAEWLTKEFDIIDTGGVEIKNAPFQVEIRSQVEIAIDQADVIIFMVDGKLGLTNDDRAVAKMLYKCKKPVILAVNKVDTVEESHILNEFYSLGLGDPMAISGSHGIGVGDLLDKVVKLLPEKKEENYDGQICFSIIGRPNVGKSSLVNALLDENRVIVSPIEGTTRDCVDTPFTKNGRNYVVIDTAGLKKRGKIYESIDKYSAIRALSAIERSDVVLFVIDAKEGILAQDKHVVGYAYEKRKAIIIVVNKWDLVKREQNTMSDFVKNIRKEFKFLDFAPIVFISALEKKRLNTIYSAIDVAYDGYTTRIQTSTLNEILQDAQMINPPPYFNGGRIKIYFGNQVDIKPPSFVLFVNEPNWMHFSYQRFLENRLRETFKFEGTPINIICRVRK